MTNLAALIDDAGDHDIAADMFRNIGSIWTKGGDKSGVACSVANQGVAAARAGDLEHAQALFSRSHGLHQAAGNWLHSVHDLFNLSGVETERGNLDQALSYRTGSARWLHASLGWLRCYGQRNTPSPRAGRVWLPLQATIQAGSVPWRRHWADIAGPPTSWSCLGPRSTARRNANRFFPTKRQFMTRQSSVSPGLRRARDAFQFCERARMRSFLEALGSSRIQRLEAEKEGTDRRDQRNPPSCSAPRRRLARSRGSWMS